MPDTTAPTISIDDYLALAQSVGSLVSLVNPASAGAVAVLEGAATLLNDSVLPLIQHLHAQQLSIVAQATLAAQSAAERARVGAAPATIN